MKLKYIDVLRGLAVLGVLIVHCGQYGLNGHYPSFFQSIIDNGARGVQLFYIVSAFTIFLSMDRRYEVEKHPNRNFFIRRIFRIVPMYYVAIIYYLWKGGYKASFGAIFSNFFFVHGLNPHWLLEIVPGGWSVGIEMLFYASVPLLFMKIKNTRQAFIFLLITLAINFIWSNSIYIFYQHGHAPLWYNLQYFMLPSQLAVFALGILYFFIVKEDYRLKITPGLMLVSAFILIANFVSLNILSDFFLISIAFVILAIALSQYEFRFFISPIFIHMGKVSYSLYLVHHAVLYMMTRLGIVNYLPVTNEFSAILNYGIRLIILTCLATVVATFFYKVVELPMQNVGKKLIKKLGN